VKIGFFHFTNEKSQKTENHLRFCFRVSEEKKWKKEKIHQCLLAEKILRRKKNEISVP